MNRFLKTILLCGVMVGFASLGYGGGGFEKEKEFFSSIVKVIDCPSPDVSENTNKIISMLEKEEVNVNCYLPYNINRVSAHMTPLYAFISNTYEGVDLERCKQIIDLLLEKGANLRAEDKSGIWWLGRLIRAHVFTERSDDILQPQSILFELLNHLVKKLSGAEKRELFLDHALNKEKSKLGSVEFSDL